MTPKERAEKSAEAMWAGDQASKWLGMSLISVDEGHAVLSLTVGAHQTNALGTCHGGVSFALADSAFAFACNSRNQVSVGQHTTMSYLTAAEIGDVLTAEAREVSLAGRSGVYDVTVKNQNKTVIAEFRGCSRAIRGQLFEE